jgi:hypothetical protein
MHGSNIPTESIGQVRRPCAVCGKPFIARHTGRKRLFCSSRCRTEARRQRSFVSPGYPSAKTTRNAENSSANSTACKAQNSDRGSRFSVPLDLLGGRYQWPSASRLDPELRRRILAIELGE